MSNKLTNKAFKGCLLNQGYLGEKHPRKFKAGADIHLSAKQLLKRGIATHYVKRSGEIVTKLKK